VKKQTQTISLCLASREEPHLVNTVVRAFDFNTVPSVRFDISVWFDGAIPWEVNPPGWRIGRNQYPEGSSISKHRAIMHATGDIIVLIDAHMILPAGWDKAVLDHFADPKHAKDVLCGKMICMDTWGDLTGEVKTGAEILLKYHSKGGFSALQSMWKAQPAGEIGCCLGAFYAFRKAWYIEIGEPLGVMEGWGAEEEMLSLGSWIMGGRVVLADIKAAHLMTRPPKTPLFNAMGKMWRNRFRLLNVVPLDGKVRKELYDWLWMNHLSAAPAFVESVSADTMRPEVIELKRLWASRESGWTAYSERFLNMERRHHDEPVKPPPPPPTESGLAPVIKTAKCQVLDLPKCPKCGKIDKLRIVRTVHDTSGNVRRYGKCGNKACKARFSATDRNGIRTIHWNTTANKK
jgi:hypothetical protein